MGCKTSMLECIEDRGETEKRKQTDMLDQGSLLGKAEYDILRKKSSFEDVTAENDEDADYSTLKGPESIEAHPLTNTVPSLVKILLVFPKDDQQMDVLATTSRRLGWSVSVAKDAEKAVEFFQSRGHELVIIDHRGQRAAEADMICRAIRSSPVYHNSVIIALVKKSFLMHGEKDKIVALDLLETGFTRALMECSHERILINELVGIYTSALLPRTQLAAANALYLALDRCRDMVHVTNDKHIVQFVNKISEKLLGYKTSEILGKSIAEIVFYDNFILMEQHISKGREFEGNMNCKRKNNQMITISCRVIPFCVSLKKPTHYIYIYDTTYLSENIGSLSPAPTQPPFIRANAVVSQRRTSDIKSTSESRRRSSLHKLHSLQLEAPITKVISLLSNSITESTTPDTAAQIEKAIEILKTTELYVPSLREDTDPVATDLVGALLSSPRKAWESRRSSVESGPRYSAVKAIASNIAASRMQIKGFRGPQEIAEILDRCLEWNFDIFKLEILTEKRPLLFLGMTVMNQFRAPARLGCEEKIVQNWLTMIEMNYQAQNVYHNSTHAADVLQATARFMQSERLKQILEPLDEVATLIAAAAHDVDHPGRSSQFLCNADDKLAILYNDLSVLESHHAALTFKLSLSNDNVNIFKNLERDTYKQLRQTVIDMILATEMTKHFEHLARFMNICSSRIADYQQAYSDTVDMSVVLQPDNVVLVKRMMIKCADVSNPTRPLKCCIEWARRITEEYFSQTDEEKKLKLPVQMAMFDRLTCSIPKAQIGFVDFIINDMVEAWDAFIDMPEMVGHMRQNYEKWKEYNMSVVPLIFRDWWDDFDRPVSRLMDQHFARGLNKEELVSRFSDLSLDRPLRSIFRDRYYRPWRNVTREHSSGSSTVQIDSQDNFQVFGGDATIACGRESRAISIVITRRYEPYLLSGDNRYGCDYSFDSSVNYGYGSKVILDVQQFSPEEITVKTVGNNVIVEAKHEEKQDEHGFVSRHFIRRYQLPSSHDTINVTSSLSSDGVLTITAPKKGETPAGTERIVEIVKTGEPASKPIKIETTTE
ncbi:High affinity cAMP-specific and IBMX-insensitive 3',5'-cyclic phosphodiesterase 8B [Habropoda laboriosa]|uniref:3',5'-cyclic-AMP phosphodiesterase n=1 Tax=Habropoda laboriosa TaxID=597456 RepID=A0A0L7QMN5_9HYME|nr:High affinity cAMP-specific and IBMX-insensitive 3',5'-cyclic phosphodiesterase 8B [Habropoda laboriosa]